MKNKLALIILSITFLTGCSPSTADKMPIVEPTNQTSVKDSSTNNLTEVQAKTIAEKTCIKGGESLSPGSYNENTKTWWFDANLNATKEGCNPACVVSEDSGKAEINWRCTGLKIPETTTNEPSKSAIIRQLFAVKYPQYANTLSIKITQEDATHARGSVNFVSGEAGGNFLAAQVGNDWKIVFDGNGQIPCSLSSYDFPAKMLEDCAK